MDAEQNASYGQPEARKDVKDRSSSELLDERSHGPIVITDEASVVFNFSNIHYQQLVQTSNKHTGAGVAAVGVVVTNLENVEVGSLPLAQGQDQKVIARCTVGGSTISFQVKAGRPVEIDFDSDFMLVEDQDPSAHSDSRKIFRNAEAKLAELLVTDRNDNVIVRTDLRNFKAKVAILETHLP
jgi:hypothetical protein